MVRTQDLIEKLGEEYAPMLKQIQIPDFTKCIAQLSNISLQYLPDKVIEVYLTQWCRNKKKFFDIMGGKTRIDIPFEYIDEDRDYANKILEIGKEYPAYYFWLDKLKRIEDNKISFSHLSYETTETMKKIFDGATIEGMSLTRFLKSKLDAPNDLVTKVGRVYENRKVEATFTISIDPVDMMLASENPYQWTSCYRLENYFDGSHADGCLAAVIDSASIITYVWNNEGKFNLYDNYEFKDIRYKRMRMWIALSEDMKSIHFNEIYPGKSSYSEEFHKTMRLVVEKWLSDALEMDNSWINPHNYSFILTRGHFYGYHEFHYGDVWTHKGDEPTNITPYNEVITCPCGCGYELPGTDDDDDDYIYNGNGMVAENFEEKYYCEYIDDYCDCHPDDRNCEECSIWRENNAVCCLDHGHWCGSALDAADEGCFDSYSSNVVSVGDHCDGCPLYKLHHPDACGDVD